MESSDRNEEAIDNGTGDGLSRRTLLRNFGFGGAALALSLPAVAKVDKVMGGARPSVRDSAFPSHPKWKFVINYPFITIPFFVPMNYGGQDASTLFNVSLQVTGSQTGQVSDQIDAMNVGIAAGVDGMAVTMTDLHAFDAVTARALKAGIPVISINVDAPASGRLAYLGQTPATAGFDAGELMVSLVRKGEIAIFLNTPGITDLEERQSGVVQAIKQSGKPITYKVVASGSTPTAALAAINAYYLGHPSLKGLCAVDSISADAVAQVMKKYGLHAKGVSAGGFDLTPTMIQAIENGNMDYTVDQQPYLMGFDGIEQLFLYKLSGGLMSPADTNTGTKLVTKQNVGPYSYADRFEGSSSKQKYPVS